MVYVLVGVRIVWLLTPKDKVEMSVTIAEGIIFWTTGQFSSFSPPPRQLAAI